MAAYNDDDEKFAALDAQVVGISVDSPNNHVALQRHEVGELKHPMCSDFYPHGEVAEKYGILRLNDPIPGISERAVFVVDKKGKIAFSEVYHLGEQPDNEDCLAVLRRLAAEEKKQIVA
ncbi:MAG: alkyl hydroperoxide reductase/Thiol specific antioxidant/Mal allergen [Candidatus Angelobacter sp.]|jgi:alkyl hydroperoxide reductase subunit AhpC|nr:alkyl hydroperoxide reductase/Thiol specific antioxidant/Mal allergen [Candidatus Angelobacter sp.]